MGVTIITTTSVGEDMEKLEPSYITDRNIKLVQLLWKIVWQFLERLNIEFPYDLAIPLLIIYQETFFKKERKKTSLCARVLLTDVPL